MSDDKKTFWKQKLEQSQAELTTLLDQLEPEQWETLVFSEANFWTVKDIVTHLVDSEQGMSIQIHKIRKGQETIPENFDLNQWNAGLKERVGLVSREEILGRLEKVRARLLQGLESLTDPEWELKGRHPSQGMITIEQYYETMSRHYMIHTADIKRALER